MSQVMLRVGETSEVTMPLRLLPDLAIWDVEVHRPAALPLFSFCLTRLPLQKHAFVQVPGAFTLEACSSSAVCPQSIELKL